MSIYKIPCPVCGGSSILGFDGGPDNPIPQPCPDCDKGYLTLEVEDSECEARRVVSNKLQGKPIGYLGECADCTERYRPMTEEEVEWYKKHSHQNDEETFWRWGLRNNSWPLFKGRKVRIAK